MVASLVIRVGDPEVTVCIGSDATESFLKQTQDGRPRQPGNVQLDTWRRRLQVNQQTHNDCDPIPRSPLQT